MGLHFVGSGKPMTRRGPYHPANTLPKHPKTLGERIKTLRKRAGWTQKELAALLHIPFQAVGNWERGESKPMPHLADQLALLFGQTREAIIDGQGFDPSNVPEAGAVGPTILPAAGQESIHLKPLTGGATEVFDLTARKGRRFTTGEVLKVIAQRLKENRPIWVLVGPPDQFEDVSASPRTKASKTPQGRTSRK